MLKKEVLEAIEAGKFHLYAVDDIDEAIEIYTDMKAGKRGKNGKFPKDSFNYLVEEKLVEFVKNAKVLFKESETSETKKG
jgi:predicted ATP-dependent protease